MTALFQSLKVLTRPVASVALLFVVGTVMASADQNWPGWRGPLNSGAAPGANPPTTWSETSNIKWKVKIPGGGSASPIVWDNLVFVETAIPMGEKVAVAAEKKDAPAVVASVGTNAPGGDRPRRRPGGGMGKPTEVYQFVLLCLDRQTGKTLWQKVAREEVPHEGYHEDGGSFASASPVTDGKYVYAHFGSRGLHCYDLKGNLKWEKDFGKLTIKRTFGEGSSPALFGNTIVVTCDQEAGSFIVAMDKETGKELWRQTREEGTSWATPLIVQHGGKAQVVTDASGKIRSYDLATGNLIWECKGLTSNVIPSPVAGDDLVYSMSGFQGNALFAIRLGRTGDITGTDAIAWSHNKSTPYVPSPLLYGNRLYFLANNNGMISCYNAKSGEALIDAERLEALQNVYASPVGASGRVYVVSRNGATVVMKDADKLETLATNRLEERFDASPAIAGRDLFLRGQESLYCISEK